MSSTFSIIGRCERTGMLGVAIATSEMAVGSRCIHVAPGVGAVISQAASNPRLGHLGLDRMRAGIAAAEALAAMVTADRHVERRQLGCLDTAGRTAARTGTGNRPWAGHRAEPDVVAAGNLLVGPRVVEAMLERFRATADRPLWERLLAGLEGGKAAGGEPDGEKSAGLYVVHRETFPLVDLRVDLHADPVAELRRLADHYFPLVHYYAERPSNPDLPRAAEWLARQGGPA